MKAVLITYGVLGLVLAGVGVFVYRKLAAGAFNPANPENVVNQGANAIVQSATGDKDQTVGGLIFDWFNPSAGLAPGEQLLGKGIIKPVETSSSADALGDLAPFVGVGA